MSPDTDEVDEAEELIGQLLQANFAQAGEETGDEPDEGGEPEDPDADEPETPGDDTEEPGEPEAPAGDEPNPAPPAPDVAQAPGPFDSLTEQEKAALLKVRSLLTDNPDIAEGFDKLVKAKFEPEPDKTLPPEIDPEDETSVRLWNEIQEQKAKNEAARAQSEARDKENSQRQVNNDIAAGIDKLKAAHPNLTDEDINNIRAHTAATVNIPAVMANFPNDPAEGVARALEIGSMTDPLTRDKVLGVDAKTVEAQATAKRQKKLSALSGSTGSGPRTKPQTKKPESWNEVAGRLAKELEALGGV